MIRVKRVKSNILDVKLIWEEDNIVNDIGEKVLEIFKGKKLQVFYNPLNAEVATLYVGIGKKEGLNNVDIKEIFAKISREIKKINAKEASIEVFKVCKEFGSESLMHAVEGLILGGYDYSKTKEKNSLNSEVFFYGIKETNIEVAEKIIEETTILIRGVTFARDVVNAPGNKLRPEDFINRISDFMKDVDVDIEILDFLKLKSLGMDALVSVGDSSKFKPYLAIVRYMGNNNSKEIYGLVGKGVTCDTGGYCLKSAGSMLGIRGDMAGGAAVIGAVHALARNKVCTNAVAIVPICENRISKSSLLPGDVISSYSGKTIEILNTDAEGRVILADAVSYGIKNEKVTKVLDIATLTGAVVNLLGFSIGGVMCDNQSLFNDFKSAYKVSGERYWRLPFYKEHEEMIKSSIANVKNIGKSHCGTLTAGLFIREFAEKKPWIHIDIAGTAWVEPPIFEYQSKGATGAGVTTIYHLCRGDV